MARNAEWDPAKAETTFQKHGVLFPDAETVFRDPSIMIARDGHDEEERWVAIGMDLLPMKKEYDFSNGKRGAIMSPPPGSVKVTLHLDKKLVEQVGKRLNAAGRGSYDMMINQAIREFLERAQETAERPKAVRTELRRAG